MTSHRLLVAALFASAAIPAAAHADPIAATLGAQYYEVLGGTDPDFPGGFPVVAPGSPLGPDGLPLATGGVSDIDPVTHEITWWSPALNAHVSATGAGTITLPYASTMYPPNSTGSNNAAAFETAVFTGDFFLAGKQDVDFLLGSDDDTFIYVDGALIGQNPGIHGVTNVDFTASGLSAGNHVLKVFYDDREQVGAYLSLSLLTSGVVITPPAAVPEPASFALFGAAAAGLGLVRRRG